MHDSDSNIKTISSLLMKTREEKCSKLREMAGRMAKLKMQQQEIYYQIQKLNLELDVIERQLEVLTKKPYKSNRHILWTL